MIKVTIQGKNVVEKIVVTGHADYEEYGKDIICASCSAIVTTSVNAMIRIDKDAIAYEEKEGLIITIMKHTEAIDKLIENMIDLLNQLASQYPKNIKMRRC